MVSAMISMNVDLNGHATRVYKRGEDGPTCLFLHGFPEHGGAWGDIFARLDGFRCLAPDQRGYGISYKPEAVKDYSGGKLARDVIALIDLLGLEKVHLIGHDWGGPVAYAVSFMQDPRLASLTIINGVHPAPMQRAIATGGEQCAASQYMNWLRKDGSEEILAANNFEKLASFFAKNMDMSWMTPEVLETYRAAWQDVDTVRCMVNWYRASPIYVGEPGTPAPPDKLLPLPEDKLQITVPHQLIWGMGDMALLPVSTEGLEAFCQAGLTRHEIADADHWVCHQKPDEVAGLIREFVLSHD